jgi:hypothetical protein
LVLLELAHQGTIGLGGDQVVDPVHGRSETGLEGGVAGGIDQGLGQEGFAGTGIADEQDITAFGNEVEREEVKDLGFLIQSGLVVVEGELVQGGFVEQMRLAVGSFSNNRWISSRKRSNLLARTISGLGGLG